MRTPIFQLFKGGQNLMSSMAPYFLGASLTDEVGWKNDELAVTLNDYLRQLPLPKKDDLIFPYAGYAETGVFPLGAFKVQGWQTGWQPGAVEAMTMTARAATYTGPVKAGGAQHWDDTTLGAILSDTARAAGLTLAVDPALADITIPYALRWESSPIDFAMRLAAEYGGVGKPAGERLSVVRQGAGTDAKGASLPLIRVSRLGSGGWNIEGEPRPQQGTVAASWHDAGGGRRESAQQATGRRGPMHSVMHPRASQTEAAAAAAARARELNMLTGSGFFVTEFDPAFSAGAMVEASGFGDGVDGSWPSERISTEWRKGDAVMSTIDVTQKPEGGEEGDE
ncbi:phage late control D family protein [Ancylobacter sp. G4_0304]|uniref:phage late control D family protein n=1 Tax=Ancylobacter sp. G4_0304 TaxID=3114289 RepID=UPI0039C5E86F